MNILNSQTKNYLFDRQRKCKINFLVNILNIQTKSCSSVNEGRSILHIILISIFLSIYSEWKNLIGNYVGPGKNPNFNVKNLNNFQVFSIIILRGYPKPFLTFGLIYEKKWNKIILECTQILSRISEYLTKFWRTKALVLTFCPIIGPARKLCLWFRDFCQKKPILKT